MSSSNQPPRPPLTPRRIEEQLEASARSRDKLAREVLPLIVKAANRELRPWSARYRRNPTDLRNDVVQAVMVKLLEKNGRVLRNWNPDRGLGLPGYLRRVVFFYVLRLFKSKHNPWKDSADFDSGAIRNVSTTEETSKLMDQLWIWECRDMLLRQESPVSRSLYRALLVEQRSGEEVARMHDMTRDAVYQWRARFKRRAERLVRGEGLDKGENPDE